LEIGVFEGVGQFRPNFCVVGDVTHEGVLCLHPFFSNESSWVDIKLLINAPPPLQLLEHRQRNVHYSRPGIY